MRETRELSDACTLFEKLAGEAGPVASSARLASSVGAVDGETETSPPQHGQQQQPPERAASASKVSEASAAPRRTRAGTTGAGSS